ncbi:MAG: hypothetical protein M1824_002573 [Vezdaea acicularis]|nr:MAG: hypothetical protein M1824_002573 [Vezdaea acicularis]
MSGHILSNALGGTLESGASADSSSHIHGAGSNPSNPYGGDVNTSQSSLVGLIRQNTLDQGEGDSAGQSATSTSQATGLSPPPNRVVRDTSSLGNERPTPTDKHTPPSATHSGTPGTNAASTSLSGLVCNVHRTTGTEPHSLVGATTTILGDKLYVFGGRSLSRTRPQLTSDLYELDLISRHWTKIDAKGDIPLPRYFHSVCALGDTKLVCYGGMSPVILPAGQQATGQQGSNGESQPEVAVMSDIHMYDVFTRTWSYIPTADTPQGRYAHCATILPSSGVWASSNAPLSALHHNPPSAGGNPNQGSIGVSIDGTGGAEMVVVGGQDSGNHYIEQVSVFNLRNLRWTSTMTLGKSCGAYRSVVSPLMGMAASRIGRGADKRAKVNGAAADSKGSRDPSERGISMLIYSNYNFQDVKLELQVRAPDGTLTEKPMGGDFSPPGLRFPNGGVIDSHFVVSGTYLTSSKQEYALWALDLRSLTWSRIDAGGSIFSQGSWNRGVLWHRRNTFVILGNRKRSLVEDYNHRRINFSNLCMVELEAFGLYDNPRRAAPLSAFNSASSPVAPALPLKSPLVAGGRPHSHAAEDLGKAALALRELTDMDLLAVGGERVPVNSRLVARRWGPYFNTLLREGAMAAQDTGDTATLRSDTATLRPGLGGASRNSSITITPSIGGSSQMSGSTLISASSNTTAMSSTGELTMNGHATSIELADPRTLPPNTRLRTLYLPHTHLTLQALVHFLYTQALPPPNHPLCSPQILCSLLQLARPYQIDGLVEACIERLHQVLDGRNAAAVFNAAAMAAGGGRGTEIMGTEDDTSEAEGEEASARIRRKTRAEDSEESSSEADSVGTGTSGEWVGVQREQWKGDISCVVGLQKRGLRGLMEGRRLRERGKGSGGPHGRDDGRVGLGIA